MSTAIINIKDTPEMKEAIRIAAFNAGFKNSSQFIKSILNENLLINKELKKLLKKDGK